MIETFTKTITTTNCGSNEGLAFDSIPITNTAGGSVDPWVFAINDFTSSPSTRFEVHSSSSSTLCGSVDFVVETIDSSTGIVPISEAGYLELDLSLSPFVYVDVDFGQRGAGVTVNEREIEVTVKMQYSLWSPPTDWVVTSFTYTELVCDIEGAFVTQ